MDKAKTSRRQKASSTKIQNKPQALQIKKGADVDLYDPTKALLNEEEIGRAIWECFISLKG